MALYAVIKPTEIGNLLAMETIKAPLRTSLWLLRRAGIIFSFWLLRRAGIRFRCAAPFGVDPCVDHRLLSSDLAINAVGKRLTLALGSGLGISLEVGSGFHLG